LGFQGENTPDIYNKKLPKKNVFGLLKVMWVIRFWIYNEK